MADWMTYMKPDERKEYAACTAAQNKAAEAAITKRSIRNRCFQRKRYDDLKAQKLFAERA